jgi:predicted metal-dependent phosphoesterase TrpH
MSYDFHTHTTFSDGTLTPEALISKAAERGIKVISVTDHDTISSYPLNRAACKKNNIELIKGIEISSQLEEKDVHILAYFAEETDFFRLKDLETRRRAKRLERLYLICERLKDMGVIIDPEIILENNQGEGTIGRPHIAREIVARGYASSVPDAFTKYLSNGSKAFLPSSLISSLEVITTVREFKGTPVLAHPAAQFINREDLVKQMVETGLQGIEVYYPAHDPVKKSHYLNLARKYNLVATGGSDYHGPDTGREDYLGRMVLPDVEYQRLKERIDFCAKKNDPDGSLKNLS